MPKRHEYPESIYLPPIDPNWEKRFDQFTKEMKEKIKQCIPRKGTTWTNCDPRFLSTECVEHAFLGHNVDAANFQFMLWDQKQSTSESQSTEGQK
jgi:hypothetical protein